MQDYIKKYFWVLAVVVVMICAFLSAKATGHLIEGMFLADDTEPAEVAPAPRPSPRRNLAAQRSKSGDALADRNMFCADCEPEEAADDTPTDPTDPNAVPITSLPLQLVATNVSTTPKWSFATIRNTDSDSQGAYWMEDIIPGAGQVVTVGGKYVDFRNETTKRIERVSLLAKEPTRPAAPAVAATPRRGRPSGPKDELTAAMDEGINKIDENKYEVDRGLVEKLLANPMSVARGARIVPSVKDGKPNGFKLYAIRPSSVYAKLGFRNGDTIHAINGFEMTSADKALEIYTKLKEASNLSITVTRRGKPVNVDYTIR